jgi:excinuclease ABC subunit B
MKQAMEETARRRTVQAAYNEEHGVVPQTVVRAVMDVNPAAGTVDYYNVPRVKKDGARGVETDDGALLERIRELRVEMFAAAEGLEFEKAARLRDELKRLEGDANTGANANEPYGAGRAAGGYGAGKKTGRGASSGGKGGGRPAARGRKTNRFR